MLPTSQRPRTSGQMLCHKVTLSFQAGDPTYQQSIATVGATRLDLLSLDSTVENSLKQTSHVNTKSIWLYA